jgi:hypothetical protein
LAKTKAVQEYDGVVSVSRAAVAHGKSHTVTRRHPNVVLAQPRLDGAQTCWTVIANGRALVAQSSGSAVRPGDLILCRWITDNVAGELGIDTVYVAIPKCLGHAHCPARCAFARRRVARWINMSSDAVRCQPQSQMAWARM